MLVMNKVGQWISDKKSKCIPPCKLWFIESEKKMENCSFGEGGRPWKNLKYCPCFQMIKLKLFAFVEEELTISLNNQFVCLFVHLMCSEY